MKSPKCIRHLPRFTVALLATAACSDTIASGMDDAGASPRETTRPDAGRRAKLRTVPIDLATIATRDVTRGENGKAVYGEIQPLDGADACIVQRRDAFHSFEPFEPLDPPVCVKSMAGRPVRIENAPGNSDLVITVEHEGMQPWVLTSRTGDYSVSAAAWTFNYDLVLMKNGAEDPWIETPPARAAGEGLVVVVAAMRWQGNGAARPERVTGEELLWGHVPGIVTSPMPITIEPMGDRSPIDTTAVSNIGFRSLPPGSARITFKGRNDGVSCGTSGGGVPPGGELLGLPADGEDLTLEMPILAGHRHFVAAVCTCANGPADGELVDLATCTFAPAGGSDAGIDAAHP
jgi:hypothetical protein